MICTSSCGRGITKEKRVERSVQAGASWRRLQPGSDVHLPCSVGCMQHAYGRKPQLSSWQTRAFFSVDLVGLIRCIASPTFFFRRANQISLVGFVGKFSEINGTVPRAKRMIELRTTEPTSAGGGRGWVYSRLLGSSENSREGRMSLEGTWTGQK